MKSAAFKTVTSFVCLIALFQSCYAVKCYKCDSQTNSECDNNSVSVRYVRDYLVYEHDVACAKIVVDYRFQGTHTSVFRTGLTALGVANYKMQMEQAKKYGYEVVFTTCFRDGCNA